MRIKYVIVSLLLVFCGWITVPAWAESLKTKAVEVQIMGVRAPVVASGAVLEWMALVSKPVNCKR
jgi:hypothetical protein